MAKLDMETYRNSLHNHVFLKYKDSILGNNDDALGEFEFLFGDLLFVRIGGSMAGHLMYNSILSRGV